VPAAPRLTDDEITAALRDLDGWEWREGRLVKRFRLRDFRATVAFVQRLVDPADAIDHHPDVSIHWDTVELSLWTHASGGITARDLRLARAIDELTSRPGST
jgi:4a-hydroxytetrahydrobiopterin dehydratase